MKQYYFNSPRFRSYADSSDMFTLLGYAGETHWPSEGVPAQIVQGIKVWVEPAVPKFRKRYDGQMVQVKSSTHRVMAQCPGCGTVVSAGRLIQHKCKVKA
jgi:hypothetical protein